MSNTEQTGNPFYAVLDEDLQEWLLKNPGSGTQRDLLLVQLLRDICDLHVAMAAQMECLREEVRYS